jgi:hypothetical protein
MFEAAFARRPVSDPGGRVLRVEKMASSKQPYAVARADGQVMVIGANEAFIQTAENAANGAQIQGKRCGETLPDFP